MYYDKLKPASDVDGGKYITVFPRNLAASRNPAALEISL